ncbi:MAG: hypothetical protein V7739_18890 [Motiliproteus sp.]
MGIEASGLGVDSYSIEIAWLDTQSGKRDQFPVHPESSIELWNYWSDEAKALHGISRKTTVLNGVDVKRACRRLNSTLRGKVVYIDELEMDRFWARTLFDGAGYINPKRQLFHLNDIFGQFDPRLT